MFLVLLILDNPEQCPAVLDAWEAAGAPGVTILASSGLGRLRRHAGLLEEMPLMPALDEFFRQEENQHRTLISIVRGHEMVERLVQATQSVTGDLNRPHTGILVVLPVLEAYGLDRQS
jgi:hypothetical protein